MRRLIATLLALATLAFASPAFAYGQFAHGEIGRIALANVRPATRAAVSALLARSALLATPDCPARTIEQASVWPDCVRGKGPRFSYTAPWHYQNADICGEFDLKSACRDGNCVSAQVDRAVLLLKDRKVPLAERVQALALLVHFVGDLHMPLHSGSHDDLGGNRIAASYGIYQPKWLNLHGIWDGVLAERAITTSPSLVRRYTPEERTRLQSGTTEDWSREAWQVSRDLAYPSVAGALCPGPSPTRVALDNALIERLIPAARLQVERAGLRLARLLDAALA